MNSNIKRLHNGVEGMKVGGAAGTAIGASVVGGVCALGGSVFGPEGTFFGGAVGAGTGAIVGGTVGTIVGFVAGVLGEAA